jgi:hypothetical protein
LLKSTHRGPYGVEGMDEGKKKLKVKKKKIKIMVYTKKKNRE